MVEWVKEAYTGLKDLYELYQKEAIQRLAEDLETYPEHLIALLEKRKGISPELARRLRYLWQIKLGKVKVPVPPPIIEFRQCSLFVYKTELVGEGTTYKVPNHKDVLTEEIDEWEYDRALTRVRDEIDGILYNFFKYLEVEPDLELSSGLTEPGKCLEFRTYELEVVNLETGDLQYGMKYYDGEAKDIIGNLPVEKIVSVLRREGVWER